MSVMQGSPAHKNSHPAVLTHTHAQTLIHTCVHSHVHALIHANKSTQTYQLSVVDMQCIRSVGTRAYVHIEVLRCSYTVSIKHKHKHTYTYTHACMHMCRTS
jgi:hypothetical protein